MKRQDGWIKRYFCDICGIEINTRNAAVKLRLLFRRRVYEYCDPHGNYIDSLLKSDLGNLSPSNLALEE